MALLLAPSSARSEAVPSGPEPVQLSAKLRHRLLSSQLTVLEDPDRMWTPDNVAWPPLKGEFAPAPVTGLNFGFTRSAYWVRFQVLRGRDAPAEWLLEINYRGLDHADLYVAADGHLVRAGSGGDRQAFTVREVPARHPVFRLQPALDQPTTYWLRIASEGPVVVPLEIWAPTAFFDHDRLELLGLGLLYGVMFAMSLQSLLFFVSLREPAHLWGFLTITALLISDGIEDGVAYQYLWPHSPWWENQSFLIVLSLGAASFITFSRHYLDTAMLFPGADRLLRGVSAGWLGLSVSFLVLPYAWGIRIATLLALSGIPLTVGSAARAMRRRHRAARFYLMGLLAPALGGALIAIENLGFVEPSVLTRSGFDVGIMLYTLLLSIGLADRVSSIRREKEQAEHASAIDDLTGIPNRRSFELCLAREWSRAGRLGGPLSLLMLDLDLFKRFNDNFGHPRGDQALRTVAQALRTALHRPADVVARYGGEEFAVVLPDTDANGARHVAELLRESIEALEIPLGENESDGRLTVSLGLATAKAPQGTDTTALVQAADEALYQAKAKGRNRFEVAPTASVRKPRSANPNKAA